MCECTTAQAVRGCTCSLTPGASSSWVKASEWKTKKHGAERRRQWRKVHLGIDADTLQIRATVVTTNEVGDSPMAAELLDQILSHETVASFTGDGAYDTQDVHEACHRRGAMPIIPPRKGARLRKGLAFTHRNEAVKACKQLGRAIWKRWSGYHRRSLVETKMNCFNRLGEKVMARTFERQVADLNILASILNRFTELGTPPDGGRGITASWVWGSLRSIGFMQQSRGRTGKHHSKNYQKSTSIEYQTGSSGHSQSPQHACFHAVSEISSGPTI